MGCSFSSMVTAVDDGSSPIPSKAMVVAADGSLLQYSSGIRASEVIIAAGQVYALCNSDKLFFDAYPPATSPDELLIPGQIYFLLPLVELNQRLSGATVAALAVRASAAMKREAERQGRRRIRVLDVDVHNGAGNFDSRLVVRMTQMKRKRKGEKVGIGNNVLRSDLATIEEIDEDRVYC
ncbi:uncharacterized protein LOC110024060 [Phalaenopsis equestris]|uniref:uncharacterized protein LOC110024060 n=1 Tax=Phalaenopsis equestris TaxID=78828 RepID=UPI0009E33282|nr:uncharacterized protein LOC110024060 [Phalaenopsis equestris]